MTLFISDKKNMIRKSGLFHLGFTVFCAIFGAIYEVFSFGVYSFYMIYAFAIPAVLGLGVAALIYFYGRKLPEANSIKLWNYGVVTLTIGCIFKGVLEIYGTTNKLIVVYPMATALLLGASLATYVVAARRAEKDDSQKEKRFLEVI